MKTRHVFIIALGVLAFLTTSISLILGGANYFKEIKEIADPLSDLRDILLDISYIKMTITAVVIFPIIALVRLFFAVGVYKEAKALKENLFVSPSIWFLATIIAGATTAAAYWVLLYYVRKNEDGKEDSDAITPESR